MQVRRWCVANHSTKTYQPLQYLVRWNTIAKAWIFSKLFTVICLIMDRPVTGINRIAVSLSRTDRVCPMMLMDIKTIAWWRPFEAQHAASWIERCRLRIASLARSIPQIKSTFKERRHAVGMVHFLTQLNYTTVSWFGNKHFQRQEERFF